MHQIKNSNNHWLALLCVGFFCLVFFLASGIALADDNSNPPKAPTAEEFQKLQVRLKEQDEEIEKLKASKKKEKPNDDGDDDDDDDDLGDKVKRRLNEKNKKEANEKETERAIAFNVSKKTFLEENKSVLPKDITDIFEAADKETYGNALAKANDIKASIVKAFFSVEANFELITPSQKETVNEYLKLTKEARAEKADSLYQNIFEPALLHLKRQKKAEELLKSKDGEPIGTKSEIQYQERIMKESRKHYLGEKHA